MKHFAKLIALVLALVFVLSLAACKKAEEVKAPAAVPATAAPEAETPETQAPETEALTEPADTEPPVTEAPETNAPEPVNGSGLPAQTDPALIGLWQGSVPLDLMMNDDSASESTLAFLSLVPDADMKMNFEFKQNGELAFSLDADSIHSLFETMFENLPAILPSLYGLSEEEFAQMLEAQGMTMDDLIELMRQQIDYEDLASELTEASATGYYTVSGDRIYVDNSPEALSDQSNYMVYRVDGSTLTLLELVGDNNDSVSELEALLPWELTKMD